jgi:hypothetical protein
MKGIKNVNQYAHASLWKDLDVNVLIASYVDDINIIETLKSFNKAINCLKKEFEIKDLRRTKFCIRLQI